MSSLELSMRLHHGLRTSLAFIGSRSPNLIIGPRLWTKDRSWAVATVVHCQSFVRIASLMKRSILSWLLVRLENCLSQTSLKRARTLRLMVS